MSPRVGSPAPTVDGRVHQGGQPSAARPQLTRSGLADEQATLVAVLGREQVVERHVDEGRIAVERLAVGERELRALDDRVDVLGRADADGREVEPGEQGELLQEDRALTPRPGLADRVPVVVEGDRRLDRRLPARKIPAREETAVLGAEAIDLVGDEAPVESVSRPVDPGLPAPGAGLLEDAPIGGGERRIAKEGSRLRRREIELRRRGPCAQQRLGPLDRRSDAGNHRIALLRVPDRLLEDVVEAERAEVAEQKQPAVEGTRDTGREQPGPGNELVAQLPEALDGRRGRGGALAADDQRLAALGTPQHDRQVAAGPVQMRLHDLEREAGRDRGVEGVAAAFEHRHAGRRGEPVRRRDHPEGAAQLGTRREAQRSAAPASSGEGSTRRGASVPRRTR